MEISCEVKDRLHLSSELRASLQMEFSTSDFVLILSHQIIMRGWLIEHILSGHKHTSFPNMTAKFDFGLKKTMVFYGKSWDAHSSR